MTSELLTTGVTYEACWPSPGSDAVQAAIDFWIEQDIIPHHVSHEERARELLLLARGEADGQVLGVSTCRIAPVPQIGELMYHYRVYVRPGTRMANIARQAIISSFEHLEHYNQGLSEPEAVGVYLEVQNAAVMATQNRAQWANTHFIYVGNTPEGWNKRLRYFEGARISAPP